MTRRLDVVIIVPRRSKGDPEPRPLPLAGDGLQEARRDGKHIRALGSGWALTDIAITDGFLINTKALNGCFDVSDKYFDGRYEEEQRPLLVVAQCGVSIGELNVYLETARHSGLRRALKTSGIGAGQTVAGAISGNTHGAAIHFGSTPDFIAGIHLITGHGKSLWIERESKPVLNNDFANALDARLIRDDDLFNATVVSFGAFGIIAAVAVETDPIYHLQFAPIDVVSHEHVKRRLKAPINDYHFEFIFNPYDDQQAMIASAHRRPFSYDVSTPDPVWIIRYKSGIAPFHKAPRTFYRTPLVTAKRKASFQFKQYRSNAILDDVIGTPGQVFTATITYFEGYNETAIGVPIPLIGPMIDVCTATVTDRRVPAIFQVRLVKASEALLGFTFHEPGTAIFEYGLARGKGYRKFEMALRGALEQARIPYTLHWSKNSGIDPPELDYMYGNVRISKWKAARSTVFGGDAKLMEVFANEHLKKAGLS